MEERVDILTEHGEPTGRTAFKWEAHQYGWPHPTVHIWITDGTGNLLLQKRSLLKKSYPGRWDVSVAGHISAGESPLSGALRELEEEIGVRTEASKLQFLGRHKTVVQHPDFTDVEFTHIFHLLHPSPLSEFTLQAEEVEALQWFDITEFRSLQSGNLRFPGFVPFSESYLQLLLPHL